MSHCDHPHRRDFFHSVGTGLYGAALMHLLGRDSLGGSQPASRRVFDVKPQMPHHEPRATAVIQLFMNGGPSQMDLFDPKEALNKRHGEAYFNKIPGEVENPEMAGALMRSPFKFKRYGDSGMWVSELMPHMAKHVDEIALIRSMYSVNITHEPAVYKVQSGRMIPGYPSMGSWVVYGLGSENQNLPAYVVLDDPLGLPVNGVENWQCGFLPPVYQGTRFRSTGSPVLNLHPEVPEPAEVVQLERNLLARLDDLHQRKRPYKPELGARIASYELAARMQLKASEALDLSGESPSTLKLYGLDNKTTESYGRRCLIARRLVERGVRFVQLYLEHQPWDNHQEIFDKLTSACRRTDQPIAGLLQDLKQRGLLANTLVIWGGEFGRLPMAQQPAGKDSSHAGRDHNKNAMVTWMAGGGIKKGTIYGATDELGFAAAKNRMSVPDWHATILHLLGMNHKKLVFERHGFNEKLTSIFEAHVVKELIA